MYCTHKLRKPMFQCCKQIIITQNIHVTKPLTTKHHLTKHIFTKHTRNKTSRPQNIHVKKHFFAKQTCYKTLSQKTSMTKTIFSKVKTSKSQNDILQNIHVSKNIDVTKQQCHKTYIMYNVHMLQNIFFNATFLPFPTKKLRFAIANAYAYGMSILLLKGLINPSYQKWDRKSVPGGGGEDACQKFEEVGL